MNKLTIIAIFGLIGFVAASSSAREEIDSQLALLPSNDEETRYLSGNNVLFSSFCIEARDETVRFMKLKANEAAASMFSTFFKSANEIGNEILVVNQKAVEEGAAAIKEANLSVPENASQEEVKEQLSLLQIVGRAAKAVISAIIQVATGELHTRVRMLKEQFGSEEVKQMINTVCRQVSSELSQTIDMKLSNAKRALRSADPTIDRNGVTVQNIGCVTAGRVAKLSQFCNLITLAGPSIYPFLGL